jgi:hypothetical protein
MALNTWRLSIPLLDDWLEYIYDSLWSPIGINIVRWWIGMLASSRIECQSHDGPYISRILGNAFLKHAPCDALDFDGFWSVFLN